VSLWWQRGDDRGRAQLGGLRRMRVVRGEEGRMRHSNSGLPTLFPWCPVGEGEIPLSTVKNAGCRGCHSAVRVVSICFGAYRHVSSVTPLLLHMPVSRWSRRHPAMLEETPDPKPYLGYRIEAQHGGGDD